METAPALLLLVQGGQDGPSLPPPTVSPGGAAPQAGGQAGTTVPADPGSPAPPPRSSFVSLLLPIAVLVLFMWLFVMRPEKKRQKERQALLESIQKGDHVVTTGGIHGQVVRLDGPTVTLKVDDNLRLKFERSAIARVASSKEDKEKAGA